MDSRLTTIRSGRTIQVRSCTTWPSAMVPVLHTTQRMPSGSRFLSLALNPTVKPGTRRPSVSAATPLPFFRSHGFAVSRVPANVTIPSTLAPGQYLLRAEIIALHLATTEGGAEFYPACIQLNVGGNQTQGPTSSEECTFPGCYSDTDPGILTPNVSHRPRFLSNF